jgi:hypothetical protein
MQIVFDLVKFVVDAIGNTIKISTSSSRHLKDSSNTLTLLCCTCFRKIPETRCEQCSAFVAVV